MEPPQPDAIPSQIPPEALHYVQPTTAEEVDAIWEDLLAVAANFPHPVHPDFKESLRQNPLACIMVYLGELPVGYVERHLYDHMDVVEIHGAVRKGFEKTGVAYHATAFVMEDTFFNQNKPVIEVAFPAFNKQALAFVQGWQFEPVESTQPDYLRYRLTRRDFVDRKARYEKESKRRKKQASFFKKPI